MIKWAAMSAPIDAAFTETLRNGLVVTIRSLRNEDRQRIADAVRALDRQSVYMRLFSYRGELTEAGLDRIMRVDPENEVALVVTTPKDGGEAIIGSGRYVRSGADRAEVAFMVDGVHQGLGIAGRVLARLAGIARGRGFAFLEADVLGENKAMLAVFARSGLALRQRREGGVVHVTLTL
jgi:RimJ/RimL family protein N-acetyltransferase